MGNIEVIPYILFLRDGMNNSLCLENSFGNLGCVIPVGGSMFFQNAKKINLKVSVSPILGLWKRFKISLVCEFIGKKVKPSRNPVLEFWSSWASCSERDRIFCISAFKKAVLTICW